MSRPLLLAALTVSLSTVGLIFSGCTINSTNDNNGTSGGTSGSNTGTSGSTGTSGGTSGTSTTTDAGNDAAAADDSLCKTKGSKEACEVCCEENHPEASKLYDDVFLACACDTSAGQCADECAQTACKSGGPDPDVTCNTCISTVFGPEGACRSELDTKCNQNADCVKHTACSTTCNGL